MNCFLYIKMSDGTLLAMENRVRYSSYKKTKLFGMLLLTTTQNWIAQNRFNQIQPKVSIKLEVQR